MGARREPTAREYNGRVRPGSNEGRVLTALRQESDTSGEGRWWTLSQLQDHLGFPNVNTVSAAINRLRYRHGYDIMRERLNPDDYEAEADFRYRLKGLLLPTPDPKPSNGEVRAELRLGQMVEVVGLYLAPDGAHQAILRDGAGHEWTMSELHA